MEFKLQELESSIEVSRIANVHYFEFTSQYQTTDDSHNFCELLYVDKGSLCVYADNYSGILSGNQLIIHRANELHSLKCNKNINPHIIIIGFECQSTDLEIFSHSPATLQPSHRKMLAGILNEGMNLFAPPYNIPNTLEMKKRADAPFGTAQMFKNSLELFLLTLIRDREILHADGSAEIAYNSSLSDVCNYIAEHYTEKILLDNICFLFGMNKTTLCQSFKQEYGITILNYIDQLKIKEAKRLLQSTRHSVSDISEHLGFNSVHYFCRYFKKHTGISPKEWQKIIE